MTTVFVHGFWGAPADWNQVLARLPLGQPTWCPDLYKDPELGPTVEPLAWADRFLHRVRAEVGERAQLVAYSMGGRLALHALLRVPGLFSRALILSSAALPTLDPGRAAWERTWAERFRTDPWDDLERDWMREPVLASSNTAAVPASRRRDDVLRESLAQSLERWSPTRHAFGADELRRTTAVIDWAFGAGDQKYLGVAKQLRDLPARGQIAIIPNAGHRLHEDAPDFIAQWIAHQTGDSP